MTCSKLRLFEAHETSCHVPSPNLLLQLIIELAAWQKIVGNFNKRKGGRCPVLSAPVLFSSVQCFSRCTSIWRLIKVPTKYRIGWIILFILFICPVISSHCSIVPTNHTCTLHSSSAHRLSWLSLSYHLLAFVHEVTLREGGGLTGDWKAVAHLTPVTID